MEYSLAAGVRAKVDRLRLRLRGWSDEDLAAMLRASRGASEDSDVKNERTRVERAMGASGVTRGERGVIGARGEEEADTVLIRGLTKVKGGGGTLLPPLASRTRHRKTARTTTYSSEILSVCLLVCGSCCVCSSHLCAEGWLERDRCGFVW